MLNNRQCLSENLRKVLCFVMCVFFFRDKLGVVRLCEQYVYIRKSCFYLCDCWFSLDDKSMYGQRMYMYMSVAAPTLLAVVVSLFMCRCYIQSWKAKIRSLLAPIHTWKVSYSMSKFSTWRNCLNMGYGKLNWTCIYAWKCVPHSNIITTISIYLHIVE